MFTNFDETDQRMIHITSKSRRVKVHERSRNPYPIKQRRSQTKRCCQLLADSRLYRTPDNVVIFLFFTWFENIIPRLLRASREGNWEFHMHGIRALILWSFAYDWTNNAKISLWTMLRYHPWGTLIQEDLEPSEMADFLSKYQEIILSVVFL